MALKKTVISQHGFEAINAYHRVGLVTLTAKNKISFSVCSHKDADKPFFDSQLLSAPYDIDGSNPIKQAYQHLKTLPEFSGAEDC